MNYGDSGRTLTVNSPANIDSYKWAQQFYKKYGAKELTDFKSGFGDYASSENGFFAGKVAMMIDGEFRDALNIPARGVDQAGFFVLNKVFTPSVLVETAFITNKADAKLLRDGKFQNTIAESLYEAVKRFAVKYDTR